ncbi:hypothetical protein B0H10DRAFT_2040515 [Mycena sp. CBHHK59/15]|nr:hypothetical protein B0H10DRAFT_2040515 [Mycena sp. CBHHK59/15]
MAPAVARKRTRKRKRRAVSSSASSSSSSSSDSETEVVQKAPILPKVSAPASDSSSSSSSDSDSESDSDAESDAPAAVPFVKSAPLNDPPPPRRNSPSPPPPSAALPTFIPPRDDPNREDAEQLLKAKFKKFWMASVADGFKDDLEEIRVKEPNLGASRLSLLIESLASGADVFTSTSQNDQGVNEMEVMLE